MGPSSSGKKMVLNLDTRQQEELRCTSLREKDSSHSALYRYLGLPSPPTRPLIEEEEKREVAVAHLAFCAQFHGSEFVVVVVAAIKNS